MLKIGQERPQAMLEYERFDDNGSVKLSIDASGQDSGYVLNWQLVASDGAESSGSLAMAISSPQSCAEAKSELPEVVSEALQSIWLAVEKEAMSTAVEGIARIDSVGDGATLKSSCSALTHAAWLAACGTVVACGATACGGGIGCADCAIAAIGCVAYARLLRVAAAVLIPPLRAGVSSRLLSPARISHAKPDLDRAAWRPQSAASCALQRPRWRLGGLL